MFSKKLWKESEPQQISILSGLVFGILLGVFIIAQAWLLSTLISSVFLENKSLVTLRPLITGLLLVIIGRGLAIYGRELSSGMVSLGVRSALKQKILTHLQKISPVTISSERMGEISTTLTQGIDRLDPYFRVYLPQLFLSAILPVLILFVVLPIDWITGLILLFTAPLIPLFMVLVGKQAEKETTRQWKLLGRLGGHFFDVIQGLKTLKVFGLSKSQGKVIRSVSEEYASVTLKVLRIAFLSAFVLEIVATISTAIIAVQLGIRLLNGQIDLIESLFILILAPEFYFPLRQLGAAYHSGMEGISAAERIYEILSIPTMPEFVSRVHQEETTNRNNGEIEFCDIYFSYQEGNRSSLGGVSFKIPEFKTTAIVGLTGSGKSTILSLILQLIQPDSGAIRVSGVDLHDIDPAWWRDQISWVPQFPYLFNDTLAANISISNSAASIEEVNEAAKKAQLHQFISSLPEGYQTYIGERGTRLSGGQAQRLAIARAFLKNAPIFIFDEPTKHLDIGSETLLGDAFTTLLSNKTVVIAAHRLNTITSSDQIILLDQGKVLQTGDHASLLSSNSFYRELVNFRNGFDENSF